MGGSEKKTRT